LVVLSTTSPVARVVLCTPTAVHAPCWSSRGGETGDHPAGLVRDAGLVGLDAAQGGQGEVDRPARVDGVAGVAAGVDGGGDRLARVVRDDAERRGFGGLQMRPSGASR
jgi:hypothetical protein